MKNPRFRVKNSKGFEFKTNDYLTAINNAKEMFNNEKEYLKPFVIISIDEWNKDLKDYIPFGDVTDKGYVPY